MGGAHLLFWLGGLASVCLGRIHICRDAPARPLNKDFVPVVVCTVAAGWLGFTMEVESFAPDM